MDSRMTSNAMSTEARNLLHLFSAALGRRRAGPAHFGTQVLARVAQRQARRGWWAWLDAGGDSTMGPALATGLSYLWASNLAGYQVLERRMRWLCRGAGMRFYTNGQGRRRVRTAASNWPVISEARLARLVRSCRVPNILVPSRNCARLSASQR